MRKSVDEKLDELDALSSEHDRARQSTAIKAALADRHYRMVAKAAQLCADALLYDLVPDLLRAYARFLQKAHKSDPNCLAKRAIARALVNLECNDIAFYLDGLRYTQPEPVWGGTMDTAIDVRCSCAMGLVATGYPRALVELVELLNDPEADARAGAARAIACGNPREAELLLRAKALAGDSEPNVIGECFTGLLAVEPEESPPFVARYLADPDESLRELAALALGESRLQAALGFLQSVWDDVLPPAGFRRVLARAVAMHRSSEAYVWLSSVLERSDVRLASDMLEALAIHRRNSKLTETLKATLATRGDPELQRKLAELWAEPD